MLAPALPPAGLQWRLAVVVRHWRPARLQLLRLERPLQQPVPSRHFLPALTLVWQVATPLGERFVRLAEADATAAAERLPVSIAPDSTVPLLIVLLSTVPLRLALAEPVLRQAGSPLLERPRLPAVPALGRLVQRALICQRVEPSPTSPRACRALRQPE